jgi:membrane protease YdiL (CAAX protease family)
MAWLPHEAFGKVKLAAFASTIVLPLVLAHALGLWRRVGLGFADTRPAFFFASLVLVCAPYLAMGVDLHARPSVSGEVVMQFFNAFGEELLFRGVIFALLVRLAPWKSIALSAVLFGAMHLIHGVMDGDWAAATHQAMVTTAGGLMFAAVRHRTGSLWCAIALHMLFNLAILFSNVGPALGKAAEDVVQDIAIAIEVLLAAWVVFTSRPRAQASENGGVHPVTP